MIVSESKIPDSLSDTPIQKRGLEDCAIDAPRHKRRHSCKPEALNIDKEHLILEAQSWSPTQIVNWSARRYGLTQQNGGQSIKEILKGLRTIFLQH